MSEMSRLPYDKAQSMGTLMSSRVGSDETERVLDLLAEPDRALPHMADVLARARRSLSASRETKASPEFHLRPHVVDEISRLDDQDVARYVFHRYRYDVFPLLKELDAYPPCVQVEPSSICNFRCVFCFQTDNLLTKPSEGHMGHMSLDLFKATVDQMVGNVEFVTLASRGEPLLAKAFPEMMAYAKGKFLGLKINTNASRLTSSLSRAILDAQPSTVVFSMDAANPDTYAQLRVRGDFEQVVANIREFLDIKSREFPDSRTITRVSGVEVGADGQDPDELVTFWRDLTDQVVFVRYNPWENSYDSVPNEISDPCSDLWRRTFVWWDGRVNPCDVDYRSWLSVGNIAEASVSALWQGTGYTLLREKHIGGQRQSLAPCAGCTVI